jgi:MATE family multidrug resistance protein
MWLDKATHHKIWALAWPMILSNISVPMLGLVDTAILGHLENASFLSAVAIGVSILSFLYWGFAFLRMGTTGLAAQALGAEQHDHSRLIVAQSMLLGLALGLALLVASPLLIRLGLNLVPPPDGSYSLAFSYVSIRIFSAPAVLINFAIIGWLIGRQNTRLPLLIVISTNLLNIGLDFWLIIGLDLKSDGAAMATVIAEYAGCGLALLVLRRELSLMPGALDKHRLKQLGDYRQLLAVNQQLFFRTLILLSSIAFFTAQGARQGELTLAANAILLNLLLLMAYGLDGVANAVEALVGDSVGKRQLSTLISYSAHCTLWAGLIAGFFSLLFWLGQPTLITLFTSIEDVQELVSRYYSWLLVLPIICVWAYLLDGIFIGATRTRAMQNCMLLSAGLVYLPCWYLSRDWGNHGLWLSFTAFNAARGISMAACFGWLTHKKRWW